MAVNKPGACWQISITVPPEIGDAVAEALDGHADVISAFEADGPTSWIVQGFATVPPARERIVAAVAVIAAAAGVATPDVAIEDLSDVDWLGANRDSFPPLEYGRFRVRGSHLPRTPNGAGIDVMIDAARAFGSGTHATTEGCLRALEDLARSSRPRRLLDMGTGSGILAIAAAKLWPGLSILGVDVDSVSVHTATENARLNGVAPTVRMIVSDSYDRAAISAGGPYDVIVSNILAGPLIRMAGGARRRLARGGTLILSGLLSWQEERVLAAYRRRGLTLVGRRRIGDWSTLVLR